MTTIKNLKMSEVIENTPIAPSLVRSLVRWHGGWEAFKDMSYDVSNYGANGGQSFIYYDDSNKFFRAHAKDIKNYLTDLADDCYDTTVTEMISSWKQTNCYNYDEINYALYCGKGVAVNDVFCNSLWCIVEELCRTIQDMVE